MGIVVSFLSISFIMATGGGLLRRSDLLSAAKCELHIKSCLMVPLVRSEENIVARLLLLAEDESSASLEDAEASRLGLSALELESNFLGLLSLLSEDGLSLTTETFLLHVISSLTESALAIFTLLVLRDFMGGVLLGLQGEAFQLLRNVNHFYLLLVLTNY